MDPVAIMCRLGIGELTSRDTNMLFVKTAVPGGSPSVVVAAIVSSQAYPATKLHVRATIGIACVFGKIRVLAIENIPAGIL